MPACPYLHECPDVSTDQRVSDEVAKHIRKLRWIGMDEEAHALERALENGRIAMLKAVRCSLGPLDAG
ncbi:MAG TPA: hypothetical protein VIH40_07560 [Xanthobacteraceae bacterium]